MSRDGEVVTNRLAWDTVEILERMMRSMDLTFNGWPAKEPHAEQIDED